MDPMREMQLAGVLPKVPDPAVEAKPQRRRFTAEYKLGILLEVERAKEPGAIGAILRREGLYSSHLVTWRRERDRVAGRTTWYENTEQIQADLDRFIEYYNRERSHQGYRLQGRTPVQALKEALGIEEIPALTSQTVIRMEDQPQAA